MLFKYLSLAALAATSVAAGGVGSVIVENHCPFTVYLWSVGGSIGPKNTLGSGAVYKEQFRRDPQSGGIAVKITTVNDGLFNGSPQTNFAYSLTDTQVFYDMSDVMGDPFKGYTLLAHPSKDGCGDIYWENGVPPAGSQVKSCVKSSDVTLTLCNVNDITI
ncbi:hypothetical protein LOZ65_000582 [Ophidiomyces ophidiicola]|nr:hypothetical protein LOZ65_000582 [Ophidiomyces ophidiicola]